MQKRVAIPRHHCLLPGCFAVLCFLLTASLAQEPSNLQESASTNTPETTEPQYGVTGRVVDDGIIDPRDTRTVVAMALSACQSGPVEGAHGYGVFR